MKTTERCMVVTIEGRELTYVFALSQWSIDEIYDAMKPDKLTNATLTFRWADLVAKDDMEDKS